MYKLIIFDWDGTLMDSAQKIANCIKSAAREMGIDEPSDEQAKSIIGLELIHALKILFPALDDQTFKEYVALYKHHFVVGDTTAQPMFQGVESGLSQLQETGVLMAVATGKSRTGMTRVFEEIKLEHYFVTTRCGDETLSKPNPQMLHEILDYTAIDPKNAIMIGDTSYDMLMAHNAGISGLGVSYGVHSKQELQQAHAIDVLDSFSEIIDWLLDGRVTTAYE